MTPRLVVKKAILFHTDHNDNYYSIIIDDGDDFVIVITFLLFVIVVVNIINIIIINIIFININIIIIGINVIIFLSYRKGMMRMNIFTMQEMFILIQTFSNFVAMNMSPIVIRHCHPYDSS